MVSQKFWAPGVRLPVASLPAPVVSRLPDRPIRVSGSGRPVTTHGGRVDEV
jgi:hypothetical protein